MVAKHRPTLLAGWAGTSDPVLAWDNNGNAYLVGLPFGPDTNTPPIGIAVYQSGDGGHTWNPPKVLHESEDPQGDDKQWAIGDGNPTSPSYGTVYAVWNGGGISSAKLRFARTTDNGVT